MSLLYFADTTEREDRGPGGERRIWIAINTTLPCPS